MHIKKVVLALSILLSMALVGCNLDDVNIGDTGTPTQTIQPVGVPESAATITVSTAATSVPATEQAAVSSPEPAATQAAAPAVAPESRKYTVQPGDTLSGLAEQFGISMQTLATANGIATTDFLYIGQELTIPGAAASAGQTAPTAPAVAVIPVTPTTAASAPTAQAVPVTPAAPENPPVPPTPVTVVEIPATPVPPPPASGNELVVVNGRTYNAYIEAAVKEGQWYHYTCEFDAAWIVLKTYGFDVTLDDLVQAVTLDTSIEPYYEDTPDGLIVYGGDILNSYSGDYKNNFLARSTGQAMRKAFEAYNLQVTPVQDRPSLEAALLRGELVWIKTTVDFKPWRPVTWVMPDGGTVNGVLGNDHALVVMGFNEQGVVIKDPLGPTSTGWTRKYEYEVPWEKFMAAWGAQNYDGLAVRAPGL